MIMMAWLWWHEYEDHEGLDHPLEKPGMIQLSSLRLVGIVGRSIRWLDMRDQDAPRRNLPHVKRCPWRSVRGQCPTNSGPYSPGGHSPLCSCAGLAGRCLGAEFENSFDTRRPVVFFASVDLEDCGWEDCKQWKHLQTWWCPRTGFERGVHGTHWIHMDTCNSIGDGETVWR